MKKCCKEVENQNPNHSNEISRLNRIIGQAEGVKKMIENNRYCVDIIIQCKAIKSAIKAVEDNILERHLNSCVIRAFDNKKDKEKIIKEILKLVKK